MSLTAIQWAWKQDVSASAKYVLLALADYADDQGVCFPAQKTLAKKCGLSRSTVNVQLQKLLKAGLIVIERQNNTAGYRRANRYRLLLNQSPNIQRRNFERQSLKSRQGYVRNHDSIITSQLTSHKNLRYPESGLRKTTSNSSSKPALKDAL